MFTRKSFFAIFLLLIFSLPVNVFAVDEEELLEAFEKVTSYGYNSLTGTNAFFEFKDDFAMARDKLGSYARINDIRMEDLDYDNLSLKEEFYEKLLLLDLILITVELGVSGIRNFGSSSDRREGVENNIFKARDTLREAQDIYDEMNSKNGSSSSGGCFIRNLSIN